MTLVSNTVQKHYSVFNSCAIFLKIYEHIFESIKRKLIIKQITDSTTARWIY